MHAKVAPLQSCSKWGMLQQVEMQLEAERAALLEKKRREQAERRRTQEELTRILDENRRKVCLQADV